MIIFQDDKAFTQRLADRGYYWTENYFREQVFNIKPTALELMTLVTVVIVAASVLPMFLVNVKMKNLFADVITTERAGWSIGTWAPNVTSFGTHWILY